MWNKLKESKTLWVAVLAVIVGVVRAFMPEFPLSDEQLLLSGGALIAFILAENLEGFRINENGFRDLWGSRKFKATLSSLVVILVKGFNPELPIDEDLIVKIISLLVMGIGVEGSALSGSMWIDVEDEPQDALG